MSPVPECKPVAHGGPVDRPFEIFPCAKLSGSIIDRFGAIVRRFSARVGVSDSDDRLIFADLTLLADRNHGGCCVALKSH
jgi:hypothetical protein